MELHFFPILEHCVPTYYDCREILSSPNSTGFEFGAMKTDPIFLGQFPLLTFNIGSLHQGAFKWQERIVDGILPHTEIIISRIQYTYSTIFTALGGRVSKKVICNKKKVII